MKIFIPIKEISQRVPKKNFRLFDGAPLYKHTLYKLKDFEVYVDTDSEVEALGGGQRVRDYLDAHEDGQQLRRE